MFRHGNWHDSSQHWARVGKELGIENRHIGDFDVAVIRDTLPFGPPNPLHVLDVARELSLFPISVFRIWAGETFKRPQAFPDGTPWG